MASPVGVNWRRVVRQAVIAGFAGGAVIEIYLYLTTILPVHGNVLAAWQWIAAAALGKTAAYSSPAYAWIGLVVHFVVCIGWAGGYAYFAPRQAFVNERWFVSGVVYGIVVYLFMVVLQIGAGVFAMPSPPSVANALVANMLFFGVPVAYVVARLDRSGIA
jgi:hypothetical protein